MKSSATAAPAPMNESEGFFTFVASPRNLCSFETMANDEGGPVNRAALPGNYLRRLTSTFRFNRRLAMRRR